MADEADCIDALQRAARELGDSPTKAAYEDLGLTPASATIQRVMGSWNAAKDAADLETYASKGSRTMSKPEDVALPDEVAWNELSADQRWHYRNREWNTERSLRRRASIREWLDDYKREHGGCRRCDTTAPRQIDFHHEDPESKAMEVNEMVKRGRSKRAIEVEVEKCTLLCANCHAKEHHDAVTRVTDDQSKRSRLRAKANRIKAERGCSRCEVAAPEALQFHHSTEKTAGVGRMISDGYDEATIEREIARCDVLCANCHRLEHRDERGIQSDSI